MTACEKSYGGGGGILKLHNFFVVKIFCAVIFFSARSFELLFFFFFSTGKSFKSLLAIASFFFLGYLLCIFPCMHDFPFNTCNSPTPAHNLSIWSIPKLKVILSVTAVNNNLLVHVSSCSLRYEARRKFGEHERCVRVTQGLAESNTLY